MNDYLMNRYIFVSLTNVLHILKTYFSVIHTYRIVLTVCISLPMNLCGLNKTALITENVTVNSIQYVNL